MQRGFKNRAQVGPEFQDLPIDGYKLILNPVARVKLIKLEIEDFFVITNGRESVLCVYTVVMPLTLLPKTPNFTLM